jgi:hypothetical protein
MSGHREPQQLPPSMTKDKKCKQPVECHGRNQSAVKNYEAIERTD